LPQEITLLKPHNTVYKLVGPSLVPQDQGEARVNVEKRLEYIRSEVYVCSAIHAIDSRKGGESRWT
jgi:chaperonin cofactor prefoldin